MVKESKFFRKQADKAESAARASSDPEVSESLPAMALGFRDQAALIKKKQKKKPKPPTRKLPGKAGSAKTKAKRKQRA
jgi:hypothetical protein